ncbi:MAG TPA: hypothetical protein VG838_02265 [Opitutaceae bacterium]|nr:hypothetical protein [Opitutaceae bacterium]
MKPTTLACYLLIGVAVVRADQGDAIVLASSKLSEAANYSWISSTVRDSRSAEMRGKTDSAGYSLVTFIGYAPPVAPAGGRSVHSALPGDSIHAAFLGDTKYVIQVGDDWTDLESASDTSTKSGSTGRSPGSGGSSRMGGGSGMSGTGLGGGALGGAGGGRRGGGGGGGGRGSRGGSGRGNGDDSGGGAPARFPAGINLPHEELGLIVANYTNLHTDGDAIAGTLTQIGAELLIVPPGSKEKPPEGAAGTFRLWIKDGVVTKYELSLSARTAPGGKTARGGFSETTTVILSDVGSSHVDVPDAARRKLNG